MLDTNPVLNVQEALDSYVKDPQNQINVNGIPKDLAHSITEVCNPLPANRAYAFIKKILMPKLECGLRLPTKYYHFEKNKFYLDCLGCAEDNLARAGVCPVWEKMQEKGTSCRFMVARNWGKLDDNSPDNYHPASDNNLPFYYNPEAMELIKTYLSGKKIELYEAYCKAPDPIQEIYKRLAPIVSNGLQAGKLEKDWIQSQEFKKTICADCIDHRNCTQCLANVLRNNVLTLGDFSRATMMRVMRIPRVVTDVLANNGFNTEDPNLAFLNEHSGDSRLVAMVAMSLVPARMQRLIMPSVITPNQEVITQPSI